MDTSEQYIKMCDCPEIQEQWRAFSMKSPYDLMWRDYPDNKLDNIWLPMQDQIQEMVNAHYQKHLKILYDFSLTVSWYINSSEQLWLAFYMHEKHSKIWSSKEEKWVN